MYTNIFHLSHIDLDGYGCQYLTRACFENLTCHNANYGPEVMVRLDEIIKTIEETIEAQNRQNTLVLITDLNLTQKEATKIQKETVRIGVKLQLLDHHATGATVAEIFEWYALDTSRCATLLTYEWLRSHFDFDSKGHYSSIVKAINAIDIWQEQDLFFEFGKVMLGMISGAREINRTLFPTEDRMLKFHLLDGANGLIGIFQAPIMLDDSLHTLKKQFFLNDSNNTLDNLVAHYVSKLLTLQRERLTIVYQGHKGILGYNIGSSSIIGNACMVMNDDYDFYMDVNYRGNFSLRSSNKMDVSKMAAHIGNGGGHPNASGGKIENYKDSFIYEEVRAFVQHYIDEKCSDSFVS